MAILTGTDIIDHLRMLKLESSEDGYLYVDREHDKIFNESIQKMLLNAQQPDSEIQEKKEESNAG